MDVSQSKVSAKQKILRLPVAILDEYEMFPASPKPSCLHGFIQHVAEKLTAKSSASLVSLPPSYLTMQCFFEVCFRLVKANSSPHSALSPNTAVGMSEG